MIAIHDQCSRQMRNRLKTTCMGLGLVRLLQDARRFEEAKTTLYMLENGFQGVEADKPSQKSCKANRLKGESNCILFMPLSTMHEFSAMNRGRPGADQR